MSSWVYELARKMDRALWRLWVFYPDYFGPRLKKYTLANSEIKQISWDRVRFEPDAVDVDLAMPIEPARLDLIKQEISHLMHDDWLDIHFRYQNDVVAHYLMCAGRPYVRPAE